MPLSEPRRLQLAENLRDVERRIAAAAVRSGRSPGSVTLIAVTKYASLAAVEGLYALGRRDFGESRPQQLAQRASQFPDDVRWHLIGHLQRNKVALVQPVLSCLHSVDSLRLLERLRTGASSHPLRLLLEVNVSGEEAKGGFAPDELRAAWPQICALTELDIVGLMTMAPLTEDPETTRPVFRGLRALRDELAAASHGTRPLPELSMGMSGDYEVAVEEGATLVRIGSRLFAGVDDAAPE